VGPVARLIMRNYQTAERALRDAAAATYEEKYSREKGEWFDVAERALFATALHATGESGIVLDLGCGTGRITQEAARSADHVAAVDFSHASLLRVRQRGLVNVTACCANISSGLPYRGNSVEAIVSCQVLQHLLLPDLVAALAECRRVLKSGGRLMLSVYNADYFRWRGLFEQIDASGLYFKRFTRRQLRELAEQTGFTVGRVRYFKALPSGIGDLLGGRAAQALDAMLSAVPVVNRRLAGYVFCELQKRD
jgi:ubiquinone/menaquinone biosynthesis C-methylase UbiE